MQDLLPYADEIVLGSRKGEPSRHTVPVIRKIVIDGPSLVYYVYSRLYPRCGSSVAGVDAQPSYTEISLGVVEFLRVLTSRQIDMFDSQAQARLLANTDREAIYFDGALPPEKQPVRLERLERARAQLENYRKQRPGPFKPSISPDLHASVPASESSIWKRKLIVPGSNQQLPQPPFMVACVLDSLRSDPATNYPVQVVPGEADPYCAAIAKSTSAAILSNDSDMTMYDLGSDGSLVLLNTLDLSLDGNINHDERLQTHILKAQRLHPTSITRRLGLKIPARNFSLLRFGFERACDPSASTGEIISRCTLVHVTDPAGAFERFCELYTNSKESETVEDTANTLGQLDPRLSELYCQYNYADYVIQPSQDPHVYMPLIIEDPSRDSSWTYGKGLRILAYSLLKFSAENSNNLRNHGDVIEFQRRGPRIVGVSLRMLSNVELLSSMEAIVRDLNKNTLPEDALLQWRLFSFKQVNEEKTRNGKPTILLGWATEFFNLGYVGSKLSWEDIHVYANIQAVLYSLWMLKQACSAAKVQGDLRLLVDNLSQALGSLGPLQWLMASRWEIASHSQDVAGAVIAEGFDRADLQPIGPETDSMGRNKAPGAKEGTEHTASKAALSARDQRRRANGNIFEMLASS